MSFSVEWSKAATKQLLSIPKKQRLIILSWVQEHLTDARIRAAHRMENSFRAPIPVGAGASVSTASWQGSGMEKPSSKS